MTLPAHPIDTDATHAFVARWAASSASELSTAQSFVIELCALLGVAPPHPTPAQDYMFERPVTFSHGNGSTSAGRIDCYRRGHFVLEAKKLKAGAHTKGFDDGLLRARSQGEAYARSLPADEGRPPFVLVVDVGTVIEVYAEFSRSGGTYTPFPDPRSHRLLLADLARPEVQARLRRIWQDPDSLNPARISAQVTRGVAALLARLAKSLEEASAQYEPNQPLALTQKALTAPETVAAYLTRCLFCMFAEDVELLPKGAFQNLLQTHRGDPATLQHMLRILWADMDKGGFSAALAKPVLHFNGKLFKGAAQDGYSLLLTPEQIDLLIEAARANWREVEPAIFGTLLERALDPTERHALGAHYTPRAYVERLVLPTVIEPLRADWANAQAAALVLAHEAAELSGKAMQDKLAAARAEVKKFHHQLCTARVLDPACGSANFLYVTLEHLKRLEGEVLVQLEALGQTQDRLGFEGETVTLQQLRGIELNERAAALAELVLWIGFLQWHIRTHGNASVAEPVVHNYGNIECRDAVLAWDALEPAYDEHGKLLSRWDGTTFKTHPVTGEPVPDEAAQVPQWRYVGARKAEWPQADFIVGNPPFIGNKRMRDALGDGYVETLRRVWDNVPDTADFVMYWWALAASKVTDGTVRRIGLITTNSLTMIFNRKLVQGALDAGAQIAFAIPDHPWVDSANGAAVRIAMTVVTKKSTGLLQLVVSEHSGEFGEVNVTLAGSVGHINADLTIGANVTEAAKLIANSGISFMGMIPLGAGFWVTRAEAVQLGLGSTPGIEKHVRRYLNGKDLMNKPRGILALDFFGLTADEVRQRFPAAYQWIHDRVKPQRDQDNRETRRRNWWLFGESVPKFRVAVRGLTRYIGTAETAKHRVFQFLDGDVFPDQKIRVVVHDSAFTLGVLSSQLHASWAIAAGGKLGVGNDPVYNSSRCFETFAFPSEDTGLTNALRTSITGLAEQIDDHRKRQQAAHPDLTLTGMYNVLTGLREGRDLTAKEKTIHTQGLVGVLRELHDELDAAVLAAYGLPASSSTDDILMHLVQLNTQRAAEEAQGRVRWLRPEFQNPQKSLQKQELPAQKQQALEGDFRGQNPLSETKQSGPEGAPATAPAPTAQHPWPATLPAQVRAVAEALARSPVPLTLPALEQSFKGRGPWKKGLPTLLQTLEALGRAQTVLTPAGAAWHA